jgi:hypothetical protein
VDKTLAVLTEIEELTLAQRGLIGLDDKSALEQNISKKEALIQTLKDMPPLPPSDEAIGLMGRIAVAERENIGAAKGEMENLRTLIKKAQEGMTTVRGYDALSSGVGATYIDRKR